MSSSIEADKIQVRSDRDFLAYHNPRWIPNLSEHTAMWPIGCGTGKRS